MNRFVQSDIEEAKRITAWLSKRSMRREKQWIDRRKGIPTAWYAISVLAPQNGIKCLRKQAKQSRFDGKWYAMVQAQRGYGKLARTHVGASVWTDRRIAICFAYRNAIRQLLPMELNEQLAYRDTQRNAIRKYA